MSRLGEFLERFYGADSTFCTVQGRIRHRKRAAPQGSSTGRRFAVGRRRRDAMSREKTEKNLAFWARLPEHVRIETTQLKEGQTEISIEVVNGEEVWKRHGNGTVERGSGRRNRSREGNSLPTEFQRHFDRGLLRQCFAALTLEANGTCQVADRECLNIRAIYVPGAQRWPHWLAWEATEFEFAADVERAVLLSIVGKVDGQSIETHEVLEVAFDQKIDDSVFVYEPKADESVEPAIPIVEHITLEAAVARAPFTVLRPTRIPESQRVQFEVMYHPVRPDSSDEHLSIYYRGAESFEHLWINQRARRDKQMQEELEWDELEIEGRRFEISDPNPDEGLRVVAFEHDTTHVDIISDLPNEDLLDIATSMTPVSEP